MSNALLGLALALSLAQPPPPDAGARPAPKPTADAGVAPGALPLVPRLHLLGNPERDRACLSPDGKRLAWLAPDERNVLQVWVRTLGQTDEAKVTADPKRGLHFVAWAEDSNTLLTLQDSDGDENFHLISIDLATKNVRDLTPWQGVRAELLATSARLPEVVLVTLNVRDRKAMDVWRVNLRTGATEFDTQNPGDVVSWVADANFQVRGAVASTKDGGTEVRVRDSAKAPWRALVTAGLEENLDLLDFSLDGKTVFLVTSIAADTSRLVEKSLKTGTERVMAQNAAVDVGPVWVHPLKHSPLAARFEADGKPDWTVLDYNIGSDFTALKQQLGSGAFEVVSADRADATWVVRAASDVQPPRYLLWERKAKRLTTLFSVYPRLDGAPLASTSVVAIPVRDGFTMQGYFTEPVGSDGHRPLVLLVHGGPWARVSWGYDGWLQWLVNRGYAVLQVNFRGSSGYGKRFLNAGNKEWGRAMQDDLTAAVRWARDSNRVDGSKVAIVGASYGGYAALAGLAFTPDLYQCGVDVVGPANLFTLLGSLPPYWEAIRGMFARRVGDPADPADKELLTKASPLFAADAIKVPLLMQAGANDPRVKQAESEQMFSALEKRGVPVSYALYTDEGHGFARAENRLDSAARIEGFLGKCLGGRVEPFPKEGKVEGASVILRSAGPKR